MFAVMDPTVELVLGLLAIPLLVAVNGFFVAAEFALVAVRKTRVEELVKQGRAGAQALMAAINKLDDSVAASQLGITLASLALGFVSEPALHQLLDPLFDVIPANWKGTFSHTASVLLTLGLVTYLHVVFGEQMPKITALHSAERIGLLVAPPMNLFSRFTRPIVRLMNGSSNFFLRRFGYDTSGHGESVHSVDELRLLIEDTEEAGLIDAEQADFVLNVFALSDKTVADCMVPREKMTGLDVRAKREEILSIVQNSGHTRLPVWEDSPDNIIGIVNTKELVFLFLGNNPLVVLDDMLYPATFFQPTVTIANALRTFKKTHKPMGVIRDRDEKVLGLITLEDVIEEIIGDIEDEHDVKLSKLVRRRGMRGRGRK
ncbi:MAG: hemolysin family protein [Gemmataceae bacterium]